STETNTSAQTMPTNTAATSSMPLMKRSMALGFMRLLEDEGSDPSRSRCLGCNRWRRGIWPLRPASIRRIVPGERGLEVGHDRIGVAAGLAYVVGPGLHHRLGRLFPLGELLVGDGVDLAVGGIGRELRHAGPLEVDPLRCHPERPLVGAVSVDGLLLLGRHLLVLGLVHDPHE